MGREQGAVKRLYGSKALFKVFCPKCDDFCLTGNAASCDEGHSIPEANRANHIKRETGRTRRRRPSMDRQRELLEKQKNRCFWCGDEFGEYYATIRGNVRQLKVVWDHFVPYSYTGSSDDLDFVASCGPCNGVKYNHLFDSEEECREYVVRRSRAKRVG